MPYLTVNDNSFVLIAGPCVVENEEMPLFVARKLKEITSKLGIPFIFKSSYKKANRTSADSFMGIGDEKALKVLAQVREEFKVPVLTDYHTPQEAFLAAQFVDVLQVPAFLARQTELIQAGAQTGKPLNIKKGQFMSGEAMRGAVEKAKRAGATQVWLTERGTFFGYNDLVVDFRNIVIMKKYGDAVVYDCTHSVQQPSLPQGFSGGRREFVVPLARAAIAIGVDALFMEVHPEPEKALSDAASQLPLEQIENILLELINLYRLVAR
ncbi:MAG: 3-deoxy-8-phosphooctulonate synthase [Chlorobi bacterium]|nr:3-deoxy-8-phosphooctulonate synthase [Chlorobiota bacterium]